VEWVVREGVGTGGEMTQVLYAHMNNKTIKINKNKNQAKIKNKIKCSCFEKKIPSQDFSLILFSSLFLS
jgi:hypothetical protein